MVKTVFLKLMLLITVGLLLYGTTTSCSGDPVESDGFTVGVLEGKWQSTQDISSGNPIGFEFNADGTGLFGAVRSNQLQDTETITASVIQDKQIRIEGITSFSAGSYVTLYFNEDHTQFNTNSFAALGIVTFSQETINF